MKLKWVFTDGPVSCKCTDLPPLRGYYTKLQLHASVYTAFTAAQWSPLWEMVPVQKKVVLSSYGNTK